MPPQGELVIAKCTVRAAAEDPDYRQSMRCGRHEMLADELPFVAPNPYDVLLAHVSKPIPSIREKAPDAPEGPLTFVERATQKKKRKQGKRGR